MSDNSNVNANSDESNNGKNVNSLIDELKKYFDDLNVQNKIVTYQLPNKNAKFLLTENKEIPLSLILKAILFRSAKKYLLVITTMNKLLDYVILSREMCCDNLLCELNGTYCQYYNINLNSYLPLPKYLNIPAVLDATIKEQLNSAENIFIPTGSNDFLIQLSCDDYFKTHIGIKLVNCSVNIEEIYNKPDLQLSNDSIVKRMNKVSLTESRMKERVHATFEMPVMPNMADQLLKLRINPAANAHNLSKLVEQDPSLSAQLISWACSPYYGYLGKITSVEDAIIKVLGFDLVMNIALGIAIGQIMSISDEGKLGLTHHWKHSLYAASLIETLVKKIPISIRPYRGLAYLCGLLHNFGHLLLGQVFPQQFHILNQMILANSNLSILDIEHYLFDTDHQKIGSWLMQIWHMPEELSLAVANHHDSSYVNGSNVLYANLVLVTNRLLARQGIGDEFIELEIPEQISQNLKIPINNIEEIFQEFWSNREGLDNIVDSFARTNNIN
jgi:HD-like signal output (HDOD) protein